MALEREPAISIVILNLIAYARRRSDQDYVLDQEGDHTIAASPEPEATPVVSRTAFRSVSLRTGL